MRGRYSRIFGAMIKFDWSNRKARAKERRMFPQALGYVGFHAKDLDDWRGYGAKMLGFQLVDKGRSSLAFRMDDRKQRVIVDNDGGEGVKFFGWEVADAAALDALGARLEQAGVSFARGSRALADERHVKDLIVFNDPLGTRVEVFHGGEIASDAVPCPAARSQVSAPGRSGSAMS